MFKKKRNKNSKQNFEIAEEIGKNKVNKEDETPDSGNDRRRRSDDYDFEFGSDYGDNFFTSEYERQNFNREMGIDEITNMEMSKDDCCDEE